MKNKIIILLMILILMITFTNMDINLNKIDIQEATYQNLVKIEGVGHVIATRIVLELKTNKTATIDDIDDILGVGPIRRKNIEKVYK